MKKKTIKIVASVIIIVLVAGMVISPLIYVILK